MKLHNIFGFLLTGLIVTQSSYGMSLTKLRAYLKRNSTPEDVLVNHIAVIQELKQCNAAKNKDTSTSSKNISLTQTEAHLKVYKKELADYFTKYPWLQSSLEKIIEQERIHDQNYYVFYHSQISKLGIMQDFLKEVYQLLHMEKIYDFVFLRNPYDLPLKENAQRFLDNNTNVHDHEIHFRRRLLSVNLAFFGNITRYGFAGECTFDFLISHRNISAPDLTHLMIPIFSQLKMDNENFNKLMKLSDDLQSKYGVLLQIFVPKEKIDECVYLSKPFGRPWETPILAEYFDPVKKRHTKFGPILDFYKSHPEQVKDLDGLQARILIDRDMMLNPKSGIKIIRHGALPFDVNKKYKEKVKEIAADAVKKLLKNGVELAPVNPDMGKPPLQRLQEIRARL